MRISIAFSACLLLFSCNNKFGDKDDDYIDPEPQIEKPAETSAVKSVDQIQKEYDDALKELRSYSDKNRIEQLEKERDEALKKAAVPQPVYIPPTITISDPDTLPSEKEELMDITMNMYFKFGRWDSTNGGEIKKVTRELTMPKFRFDLIVKAGVSCKLEKISEVVYSCDYVERATNCVANSVNEICRNIEYSNEGEKFY